MSKIINLLNNTTNVSLNEICKCAYTKDNDMIILGGTLIEGIGNELSDLDVYVIVTRLLTRKDIDLSKHPSAADLERKIIVSDSQEIFKIFDYCRDSGFAIDTEYWSIDQVQCLFVKCKMLFEEASKSIANTYRKRLSVPESNLIHQILIGTPAKNAGNVAKLLKNINKDEYCYYAYSLTTGSYSEILDISGACKSSDFDRAYELTRDFLLNQIQGFTHLNLNSNLKRKWVFTYVKQLPNKYNYIKDCFFKLLFSTVSNTNDKKEFVYNSLNLIDEIYKESRVLIQNNSSFPDLNEVEKQFNIKIAKHQKTKIESLLLFRKMLYFDTNHKCADFIK